jgi:uncharacterized protein with ParB-like and HNH nuclease domain
MAYKPRTLFRLIGDMSVSLFLPHIQRPSVWDEDQIRRLFDSLMRDYPIQTLLFWRIKDQIMARRLMLSVEWDADLSEYYEKAKSDLGVEKVFVLDGQQRLKSLFAVFTGALNSANQRQNCTLNPIQEFIAQDQKPPDFMRVICKIVTNDWCGARAWALNYASS